VRITYDPAANAVYVQVAMPTADGGQPEVTEQGVIVDLDAAGNARGFEFLSVRERGLPLDGLPSAVVAALEAFIASGALAAVDPIERDYP